MTNLLGLPTSPSRLVDEFEAEQFSGTYKGERNEPLSANCHVLDALLHSLNPPDYLGPITKVTRFLCKMWNVGRAQDKWVRFGYGTGQINN